MATGDALNQAITAFRDPTRVSELRSQALAPDVVLILRIAAGEQAAMDVARDRSKMDAEQVGEAAIFYLQQVLFSPNANAYRILGCAVDATQQQLKENYRWLIKWLHPDRNSDQWESVYADKVNMAWQSLKTPARRERYNAENELDGLQFEPTTSAMVVRAEVPLVETSGDEVLMSGKLVKHLPAITLSIMGVSAAVLLALIYWVNRDVPATSSPRLSQAQTGSIDRSTAGSTTLPATVGGLPAVVRLPSAAADEGADAVAQLADGSYPALADETEALDSSGLAPPDNQAHADLARLLAAADLASTPNANEGNSQSEVSAELPAASDSSSSAAVAGNDAPVQRTATLATAIDSGSTGNAQTAAPAAPRPPVSPLAVVTAPAPSTADAAVMQSPSGNSVNFVPTAATQSLNSRAAVASSEIESVSAQAAPAVVPSSVQTVAVAPPPAPVLAGTTTPAELAAPPSALAPSATEAAAVVEDFASAYSAGDLSRFDRLFSGSVTKHRDLTGLRDRMQESQMRYLELADVRWELDTETAIGYAAYRETFVPQGERRAVTRVGNLQWVIRMSGSQARIAAISVRATPR